DARRLDAAPVQQIEDELAEGVGADLAERGGAEAEPREAAGGVERAAAAAQLDGVDEAERPRHGQPRHRPDDDVGDEDSEADDVRVRHAGHASARSTGTSIRGSAVPVWRLRAKAAPDSCRPC